MNLYHIEVYMPDTIKNAARVMMKTADRARLSQHTKDWLSGMNDEDNLRRFKHRYTEEDLRGALVNIAVNQPTPFEVGVENGVVIKYAVRVHLNNTTDISVVHDKYGVIRTAWLNRRDDVHKTLDRTKYVRRP